MWNITHCKPKNIFFFSYSHYNPLWVCILQPSAGAIASSRTRFLDHPQRRATVGRTPLDEWSVRRRDLYLTTHNTHNRQTSMLPVVFEPTIAAGERPQTYALDRAATGTGGLKLMWIKISLRGDTRRPFWVMSSCLYFYIFIKFRLMKACLQSRNTLLELSINKVVY